MAEDEAPYVALEQRRIETKINQAINQLPEEQAEVIRNIYMAGKTHTEVAELSGLPLGTIKSRVRLAMVKLRISIGEMPVESLQALANSS